MLRIAKQTVHTLDGSIVASEVLARLQIGSQVLTPPAFMNGCSAESWFALDMEVIKIVGTADDLKNASAPTFVNISPATLENDHFLRAFCQEIERQADTRKAKLVIEIPEMSALQGRDLTRRLEEIEFSGADVAIDDFGREHASQERLELFSWRYCKIDLAAFQEQANLDWLDSAIRYARANGIQLIMEKLESFRDIEALSPVKNTAWYQGYCYAMPALVDTPNAIFGHRRPRNHATVMDTSRAVAAVGT